MKRQRWRVVTAGFATLACIVAVLVPASPANANVFYPSGCQRTTPNPWLFTCTQGQYFVDYGTSVLGVQYVLFNVGMSPGTPDCDFGPKTDAATIRFQRARGLTADGEVGPNAWTALQSELVNSGISDVYGTFWSIRADIARFYYQYISNTWFVLDPYATPPGYRAMTALGTGGQICP